MILLARIAFVVFIAAFIWSVGFVFVHFHRFIGAVYAMWGAAAVILMGLQVFSLRRN